MRSSIVFLFLAICAYSQIVFSHAVRDLKTLERITADDYVQTDLRGAVLKRAEWLDFVKNRQSELKVETDDVHIEY